MVIDQSAKQRSWLFAVCVGALLVTQVAFGAPESTPSYLSPHRFGVALVANYIDYEEPSLMGIDGFMYGLQGDYTYRNSRIKLVLHTSLELTFGNLSYDGQTFAGIPVQDDTDDWIVEPRLWGGYDFVLKGKHVITPFIGFGYRYWNDTIGGAGGYEREIGYFYSPIGVETRSPLAGGWDWGFSAEYDLFWSGRVKSHLSDVDPLVNDPVVNQERGSGYGLRFAFRFDRDITNRLALMVEPYAIYWRVDRTYATILTFADVPVASVYEPVNNTGTYGIRVHFVF